MNDLELAEHLMGSALRRAVRDYGAQPVGPLGRPMYALAAAIKRAREKAGLSAESARRLIDLYVATPSWWISGTHPAWGFVAAGAMRRLAELEPHLEEYGTRQAGVD